ncbi:hypothetical protein KCMC57_63810 (plasmid) [Kitasatospora sp. CMC57]|uniref:Uncharacterized protein n=1 Tax=Kitasatospora sp. CMC57 TaxID=3231513 RepID=A0AB33KDS6_9ACTN
MTDPAPKSTTAASTKPKCGAKTRQEESADTCGQIAGWGTAHPGTGRCKLHGGNTTNQRTAAATEIAEREIRSVLAQLDVAPVDDPLTALTVLAGQVVSWQTAIATLVNNLEDRVRYEGAAGAEQLRAEVALYERAMDRTGHVLGLIAKLNIEERLAAVTEAQADRVIAAIDAALAAAGITGPQAAQARQAAARHLTAVPTAS